MLARLGEFPVGVFGADWTLLSWTPAWAVLLGDPSARTPVERNLARAVFAVGPSGLAAWPVLQDGDAMAPALVAYLRTALVNYPRDHRAGRRGDVRLRGAHRPRLRRPPRRLLGGRGFRRCGKAGVPTGHERRPRRRLLACAVDRRWLA
ncbi:hypothetical protein [Streptomyces bluensis]|uniref:MmyB-like transcription regulator ligand binding domain-containing protein n=1 Tax=Streptomyces bluensis TaxID=33897 RepID=A0ABW6UAW5_9ACTN